MSERTTTQGYCRTCEYNLAGLPECVCPECGTAFDPNDATTFIQDPVALRRHRRHRWIKRVTVALVIGGLLYVLVPRRMLRGDMTFTCADCGYKVRIERTEPQSVLWLPFRFPGTVNSEVGAQPADNAGRPCPHQFSARVVFDLAIGGRASSTSAVARGSEKVFFVGLSRGNQNLHLTREGPKLTSVFFYEDSIPATPESAGDVLRMLMSPENMGITGYTAPIESP